MASLGQVLSRVSAFPIKRDAADRTAIKRATRMLKNNEIVGIMPEGTRRGKSDRTPELHSGAAFIAKMGHAPILPMTVRNAEHVKRKGERFRFPKITIEYGDPVLVGDFNFHRRRPLGRLYSWYAMREVLARSAERAARRRGWTSLIALFPGGKGLLACSPSIRPHHTTAGWGRHRGGQGRKAAAARRRSPPRAHEVQEVAWEW